MIGIMRSESRFLFILILLFAACGAVALGELDIETLIPLDDSIEVQYGRVGYNRRSGEFSCNVTTENISSESISATIYLVIESISAAGVTVSNAEGMTDDGKAYFILLEAGDLSPGQSIAKKIKFFNPERRRFNFTVKCYKTSEIKFKLFVNPGDYKIMEAHKDNGEIIKYYGLKDEDGIPLTLNHVEVIDTQGVKNTIVFNDEGEPQYIYSDNGVVFKLEWQSDNQLLITAISPSGQAQVIVSINLLTGESEILTNNTVTNLPTEPLNSMIDEVFMPNYIPRKNHETIIDSFPTPVQPLMQTQALGPDSECIVTVQKCNLLVENALVNLSTVGLGSGNINTYPAYHSGNGQYIAMIPTQQADSEIMDRISDICQGIVGVLGYACIYADVTHPSMDTIICSTIAAAIDIATIPSGEGIPIAAACTSGFAALRAYCSTGGYSPVPGAPSVADIVCENIDEVLDNFLPVEDLSMTAGACIPGQGTMISDTKIASSSGPFPGFTIDFGGEADIVSFYTIPVDPAPYQSYIAYAQISCAPANTQVTMSIVGTDGYTDSRTVTIQGDTTCTLYIPGAYEGVVDRVTVQISGGDSRQVVLVF